MNRLPSLIAMVGGILFSVDQVNALDNDERGTPQEISARLRAEGQHPFAHAQLQTIDKHLYGLVFTTNNDSSVGYVLKSDQPFGDKGNVFTVFKRVTDIHIFDARLNGIPRWSVATCRRCDSNVEMRIAHEGSGRFREFVLCF
jgi:hypothetical protein